MNATSTPASTSTGLGLADLPSVPRALDAAGLAEIARAVAAAKVVGIGESTRFAPETFALRDALFHLLVQQYGFRVVALQDSADVAAILDEYVVSSEGSARGALETAWRPWRHQEMATALEWIRDFNRAHPADPVRIIAVKPAQAKSADYDVVSAAVREVAPDRVDELSAHLEPIRTAHTTDEHVQRAQGIHPGRLFREHADDAAALVNSLPVSDQALSLMRSIVDFHENSVAGRGSFIGDDERWAATIINHQTRTGERVVYWDGIAHSAATPLGSQPTDSTPPTVGSALRRYYGSDYASIAIGFHHGNVGIADIPSPAPDFLDAVLGSAAPETNWLDLRAAEPFGPVKMRVISGIYNPAQDTAAYLTVADLPAAFDILIHVREVSPLRWFQ
ncbi:erythromycin esterase family protein [Nocardia sp. SYP-A9097]|uniref:erythromycin esterase family protein n=1 Tax=Nocardia sp. SYP-A9097 TaxID=2663237 RepID=UPI00129ADC89|nr:erythromycin esterase family protein [Nocardia sp. SYP-A9097]MRH92734.1 erythromycin esterase family protein [Nocardia sp. SYP-A9097]